MFNKVNITCIERYIVLTLRSVVYNPVKDHLKHISYSMKEAEKVWDEIEEASHADWSRITEKPDDHQSE